MSLVDLYLAGLSASGAPGSVRPHPAGVHEMNRRSDDLTEAALLPRERSGTLTPGQRETLTEIRANRARAVGAAPAVYVAPPAAAIAPPMGSSTPGFAAPPANTRESWKADFDRSPELQAEFTSAERYISYQTGVASGRIRLVTGQAVKAALPRKRRNADAPSWLR